MRASSKHSISILNLSRDPVLNNKSNINVLVHIYNQIYNNLREFLSKCLKRMFQFMEWNIFSTSISVPTSSCKHSSDNTLQSTKAVNLIHRAALSFNKTNLFITNHVCFLNQNFEFLSNGFINNSKHRINKCYGSPLLSLILFTLFIDWYNINRI